MQILGQATVRNNTKGYKGLTANITILPIKYIVLGNISIYISISIYLSLFAYIRSSSLHNNAARKIAVSTACNYRGLFFVHSGKGILCGEETQLQRSLETYRSFPWKFCIWHKNQRDLQVLLSIIYLSSICIVVLIFL